MKTDEFKKQRQQVISKLIVKTEAEFRQASREPAGSRSWTSSHGYKFLVQWSNLVLLRILIRKFTNTLPKSEYRAKAQVDDAARSSVANVEEGYKRSTTAEYIRFIGFSQGSLEEVKGDIERFLQDMLRVNAKKIHEEAHRLEHAFSDESINRLRKVLGNPKYDPHGKPIP